MWCFARFRTICTIWKTWKTFMEDYYFQYSLQFTKSNTPPCLFFTFFILCKWYQIPQRITTCVTSKWSFLYFLALFKLSFLITLECQINVPPRLLIFKLFLKPLKWLFGPPLPRFIYYAKYFFTHRYRNWRYFSK